jgi:hypothetical protein
LCAIGTTTSGASCIVGVCATRVGTNGQNRARSAGSVSARKAQPCENPADGARSALSSTRSTTSSGRGRSE